MTEQQLDLARRWCNAVGWKCDFKFNLWWYQKPGDEYSKALAHIFTGDGMVSVKEECRRRGIFIVSGPLEKSCWAKPSVSSDEMELEYEDYYATTEPEAVIMCAVAAVERQEGNDAK